MAERRASGAIMGAHAAPSAGGWGGLLPAEEAHAHLLQRLEAQVIWSDLYQIWTRWTFFHQFYICDWM